MLSAVRSEYSGFLVEELSYDTKHFLEIDCGLPAVHCTRLPG